MAFPYSTLSLFFLLCFFQSHYYTNIVVQSFIILPLSHYTTTSNLYTSFPSQSHLLKTSSLRSSSRFHHHHHRRRQLPLPLSPGSDYTLSLSISSTTVSLFLDTGSDLLWFPCSPFQCILCDNTSQNSHLSSPVPIPPSSSPLPCSSHLCSSAHSSLPSSDLCAASHCPLDSIETSSCSPSTSPCPLLYYAYGDGSLLASLRRGNLSLLPSLSLPNFTFACSHSALAEPTGVAGFGRGKLSLPSQLSNISPSLSSRFSYCLISHSFLSGRLRRPSPLILGRSPSKSFTYTPLLRNPINPLFYSVALLSISVGNIVLPAGKKLSSVDKHGGGGMVVDSGTTFTMLPGDTYRRLTAEFRRQMGRRGFVEDVGAEERTGLGSCYVYGNGREDRRRVPALGLNFAGNASLWLPARNYFLGFESEGVRVGCLMVMNGGDEEYEEEEVDGGGGGGGGAPAGVLGNFQQQGMEVVYDVEMGRVGFARRRCGELWDTVSRG